MIHHTRKKEGVDICPHLPDSSPGMTHQRGSGHSSTSSCPYFYVSSYPKKRLVGLGGWTFVHIFSLTFMIRHARKKEGVDICPHLPDSSPGMAHQRGSGHLSTSSCPYFYDSSYPEKRLVGLGGWTFVHVFLAHHSRHCPSTGGAGPDTAAPAPAP